jgi:nucleoside-diphosphate-sugar epimerase
VVSAGERDLTVAVTGPTGTFGFGLMPLLQADNRVARVVAMARRPFDPAAYGWTKVEYRRGDVRDPGVLRAATVGADVVVHLAFLVTGAASPHVIRSVNVEGTLNAFRAAAVAGARRFVYPSSVAAYGFHADNPAGMTEDWPVRPAARLFYAQQKAEIEAQLPRLLAPLGRRLARLAGQLPVPVPVLVPTLPLQVVHEEDIGQALLRCVVAAGPPGAYNIAADGVITASDIARELGMLPLPLPVRSVQFLAGALAAAPFLPQMAQWAEMGRHPAIMDTTRARQELGWAPRFTAVEALRDTLRPLVQPDRTAP